MAMTRPRPAKSRAACSASALSHSQIATAAPEPRSLSAIARPIPRPPPVTTADQPLRSILLDIEISMKSLFVSRQLDPLAGLFLGRRHDFHRPQNARWIDAD